MGFRKLRAAAYIAKRGIQKAVGISPKLPEMPQELVEEPKEEAPPVVEAKEAPAKEPSAPKKTESKKAPAKQAESKKTSFKKKAKK